MSLFDRCSKCGRIHDLSLPCPIREEPKKTFESPIDPNARKDTSHKEVPINPPSHSSEELWYRMNWICSVAAGFSSGPPEQFLIEQNNDKRPSELERMKKATEEPKK